MNYEQQKKTPLFHSFLQPPKQQAAKKIYFLSFDPQRFRPPSERDPERLPRTVGGSEGHSEVRARGAIRGGQGDIKLINIEEMKVSVVTF